MLLTIPQISFRFYGAIKHTLNFRVEVGQENSSGFQSGSLIKKIKFRHNLLTLTLTYDYLSSVENKRRCSAKCQSCSFPYNYHETGTVKLHSGP